MSLFSGGVFSPRSLSTWDNLQTIELPGTRPLKPLVVRACVLALYGRRSVWPRISPPWLCQEWSCSFFRICNIIHPRLTILGLYGSHLRKWNDWEDETCRTRKLEKQKRQRNTRYRIKNWQTENNQIWLARWKKLQEISLPFIHFKWPLWWYRGESYVSWPFALGLAKFVGLQSIYLLTLISYLVTSI